MNTNTSLSMKTLVKEDGNLELFLEPTDIPEPADDGVVVRIEAAPINPSDLGLMFGAADMSAVTQVDLNGLPALRAPVPQKHMRAMTGRIGDAIVAGNEGAGTVVKAGDSEQAQRLLGRTVAGWGGGFFSQYRKMNVASALLLPEELSARDGASSLINPLTALTMVETMKREGHKAIVHTAAASNLGQMLNRICIADDVPLVNIVRKKEHEVLLKEQGAKYVCNSSAENFREALTNAIAETGATLAFDAIGGGKLASAILTCMETGLSNDDAPYNRYGSSTPKQVYIYGGLDLGPTVLNRSFGFCWSVSGFLLNNFLEKLDRHTVQSMRERVVNELTTTFASTYTQEISLSDALKMEVMQAYLKKSTGEKYLINPTL